jgi:hypothetical protein
MKIRGNLQLKANKGLPAWLKFTNQTGNAIPSVKLTLAWYPLVCVNNPRSLLKMSFMVVFL